MNSVTRRIRDASKRENLSGDGATDELPAVVVEPGQCVLLDTATPSTRPRFRERPGVRRLPPDLLAEAADDTTRRSVVHCRLFVMVKADASLLPKRC